MENDTWPKYEWWKYILMPFMSGIIGWITNVLALEMTFYPLEYKGFEWFRIKGEPWGLFGWQGIIPTKAPKMAHTLITLMNSKLFKIEEIFARLNPKRFYEEAEEGISQLIAEIIEETAMTHMPKSWSFVPEAIKKEMILAARESCPQFLTAFIADMKANIRSILDIHDMCINTCIQNKEKVNKMFLECGGKEFVFIKRSGFYFGFAFGCLQTLLWLYYDAAWLLPTFGFVLGWLTNFLALRIIFRPVKPVNICCNNYQIHGLFLKRQMEVSETFARVGCEELMSTETMWKYILNGPNSANFQKLLRAHSILYTEILIGGLKPFAVVAMGSHGFAKLKEDVASKVIEKIHNVIPLTYNSTTEALDLETTIRTRMQALPPEEFEAVLHPAFEEDEMTLIFVGGVLGMLVGFFQLFAIFIPIG